MSYLREASLRNKAAYYHLETASGKVVKRRADEAKVTIFLSHSHEDASVVKGFITELADLGVQVYVDWQDNGLPRITSGVTAEAVKVQIKKHHLFLVLATPNALASRWVPWEIGVADQMKGYERIIIIPVQDSSGRFTRNEYLQIYQRMVLSDTGKLAVFEPGKSSGGYFAEDVLRSFGR